VNKTILITGSAGLVGSEAARHFAGRGCRIVGIDNDLRQQLFGPSAPTAGNLTRLREQLGSNYTHVDVDIRDLDALADVFRANGSRLRAIIHTAAQPSHDWAAAEPHVDFTVNATGTLNMLELARRHCPETPFVFTSTNKVYGDSPNLLPLVEQETRLDLDRSHPFYAGIDETMTIDRSMHSLFGVSKTTADLMTQEYGRYFGMPTVCFRCGCITGEHHAGTEQHGFLAYLMKCAATGRPYTVYGYGGKQVRDNIHGHDLVAMFEAFIEAPRAGEVYNAGGARANSCSVVEAIELCQQISGTSMQIERSERARAGDHRWWISDTRRFQQHYPSWSARWPLVDVLRTMFQENRSRWQSDVASGAAAGR
jgi:CDP-paratose 2-epimerase